MPQFYRHIAVSVNDIIKDKFLEEFSSISVGQVVTALLLSFLMSLFIVFVYWITYSGVSFNKSFSGGLVLLAMVTSVVVLAISSNIILSLGMVGALSIVRFRTAVKDPIDTVFMFWAIVTGIIIGAGYTYVAIFATLGAGLLYVVVNVLGGRFRSDSYVVVVRYAPELSRNIEAALLDLGRYKVKSKNMSGSAEEIIVETKLSSEGLAKLRLLGQMRGVAEVNVISSNNGTML